MENPIKENVTFDDLESTFSFSVPQEEEKAELPEQITLTEPAVVEEPTIEDEAEATTEEVVEEPKPNPETTPTNNFYLNLVRKNIEKGHFEDVLISNGEEEVKLSEMEDLTEEEYYEILEDQKALKEEDIKEKYVSVDGLTEEKKLILDIVKNGGDLKTIFQSEQELQKPFDEALGWDLDNEKHLEAIVYQNYLNLGHSEQRAALLLNADKKELVLDTKAKEIVDFHQENFKNKLEAINSELLKEKQEEQSRIKDFRSALSKKYKEEQIPDALIKRMVDSATIETDNGFAIDDLYEQAMQNPEQAAELIFFLTDRKKFLEKAGFKSKVEANTETLRTIKRIPKDREKQATKETEDKSTGFRFTQIPT